MGNRDRKDLKILVVDDNPQLTDTIVEMLARDGFSATGAYPDFRTSKKSSILPVSYRSRYYRLALLF
jgi:CheY-like chemotaxis protein